MSILITPSNLQSLISYTAEKQMLYDMLDDQPFKPIKYYKEHQMYRYTFACCEDIGVYRCHARAVASRYYSLKNRIGA